MALLHFLTTKCQLQKSSLQSKNEKEIAHKQQQKKNTSYPIRNEKGQNYMHLLLEADDIENHRQEINTVQSQQ